MYEESEKIVKAIIKDKQYLRGNLWDTQSIEGEL